MFFWQLEAQGKSRLQKARVDNPGLSSKVLLKKAALFGDVDFLTRRREPASQDVAARFENYLQRRERGEPVAYILGEKEFYGRAFLVSPAALIPRPETEALVELSLACLPQEKILFLDAGCGTGCIGLSLLAERKSWKGVLLDKSRESLVVAQNNATALNIAASFVQGDIFDWFFARNAFNLIVSNPPYVSFEEKDDVMAEVLQFEPHAALFSAKRGLAHIEAVIAGARESLVSGGVLLLEHGKDQGEQIQACLKTQGFVEIQEFPDLAGLPRTIMAKKF